MDEAAKETPAKAPILMNEAESATLKDRLEDKLIELKSSADDTSKILAGALTPDKDVSIGQTFSRPLKNHPFPPESLQAQVDPQKTVNIAKLLE